MCGKPFLYIPNFQKMQLSLWNVWKYFNKGFMNMNNESPPQTAFTFLISCMIIPNFRRKRKSCFEQNGGSDCWQNRIGSDW